MFAIAAECGSSEPRIVDISDPGPPGPGDVLCRTLQLGVCGTDRDILLSQSPLAPPNSAYLILGHECLAEVEAVGPESENSHHSTPLEPGQLVVPLVRRPLPQLVEADSIRPDLLAFGKYVERGIVAEHGFSAAYWLDQPQFLLPVSSDLREYAVLAEPISVAEKGVRESIALQRARLGATHGFDGDRGPPRLLVTGLGPIAFAAVIAGRCRNWPVTVYGRDRPDSPRVSLVEQFGCRYLPAGEFTTPANAENEGYDLILECTGSDEVMICTATALASCGIMVWLGSSRKPKPQPHNLAAMMRIGLLRNHLYVGSVNSAREDFQTALQHVDQLRTSQPTLLRQLITARVAPTNAMDHYRQRMPGSIKTVLQYES